MENEIKIEIEFRNILDTDRNTQFKIRDWRNHYGVRKYLFNTNIITKEEHSNLLVSLKNNNEHLCFIAYKNNIPVGVVNTIKIDAINKQCDIGIFLNTDYFFQGLGSHIYQQFIEYVFSNLAIETINCEVLDDNISSLKLHRKTGFTEDIKRNEIIHYNNKINIHLFEISKQTWLTIRHKKNKQLSI